MGRKFLSDEQIAQAKYDLQANERGTAAKLAKELDVTQGFISQLKSGYSRHDVPIANLRSQAGRFKFWANENLHSVFGSDTFWPQHGSYEECYNYVVLHDADNLDLFEKLWDEFLQTQ